MPRGREEQPLEFTDIVSGQHAAILADPYGFLGVPQDTPLTDVRRRYIAMSKLYHPDMVSPRLDSDGDMRQRLEKIDPQEFMEIVKQSGSEGTPDEDEEARKKRQEEEYARFAAGIFGATGVDLIQRGVALKALQTIAHRRMVELNVAYEAIRLKVNPKERNILAGYKVSSEKDDFFGYEYQEIKLEGDGVVDIYPDEPKPPWMTTSGPHLAFDWGPDRGSRWDTSETFYSGFIHLKHLFVHHELSQGRSDVSQVLLDPFFREFGLDKAQQELFKKLLVEGNEYAIWEAFDLPWISNGDRTKEQSLFRDSVQEMLYLDGNHDWYGWEEYAMQLEDDKLRLSGYTQSNFSETDTILLQTLAYGPMLGQ